MKVRSFLTLAAAMVTLLVLAACAQSGLSAEDTEALREELATVEERLDEVEAEVTALQNGDADPEEVASNAQSAVDEARSTLSEVREEMEPPPEPEPVDTQTDPALP